MQETISSNPEEFNFDEIDEDLMIFQEDEMVQQALQRGVDLKKYGSDLEKDLRSVWLRHSLLENPKIDAQVENESVLQYVQNNDKVIELHKQMQECDSVLARMQDMLLGFQADLSGISEEIKHLQDESLTMSVKLKNRKAVEERLHSFLENSTITVEFAEKIVSPEVNEDFQLAVVALKDKLAYVSDQSETFTGRSLLPELEKLKLKSLGKARDYFTSQFKALRKPKTNVQIVQQSGLLKYSQLFSFIQNEAPFLGEELRSMYVECMGRTLLSLFKSYTSQLLKLDLVIATKHDVIVVEEVMLKNLFTQRVNLSKRMDSFALSERDRILDQVWNW
jgi:hypothetical protein